MVKILLLGISFIILLIIGYGSVKYIETQQTINLINHSTKAIKKTILPVNRHIDLSKLNTINLPKINTKTLVKDKAWVNGRTLKECMKGTNEINNNTVKCRSGYYKEIWIWR